MEMRTLAKQKVLKVVDGQQEAALAAVHKPPEELQDIAADYSESVGFAGTTGGPKIVGGLSNIAKGIETNALRDLVRKIGPKAEDALNKTLSLSSDTAVKAEFIKKLQDKLQKMLK